MTNKPGVIPSPAVYPQPQTTKPPLFPPEHKDPFLAKKPRLIKVVIDTNVYLSGIIFGGSPRKVLELAKDKRIKAFSSPSLLLEVSQKLNKKFSWSEEKVKTVLKAISKITEVVEPKIKLKVVKEDPSDNKILQCAVVAKVNYIITGDKHLLKLKEYQGISKLVSREIKILTPSQFLKLI